MVQVKYTNWWAYKKREQSIANTLAQLDLYNKTEFSKSKNVDLVLLEEASRFAHDNKLVYYITIFKNEKPYCFLEINKGFYRVSFLDDLSRTYMSYDFYGSNYEKDYGDKLFLGKITFWEFEGNTDKMIKITDHIFKTDGTFLMIERDLITNEQIDSEAKNKIDVSSNWENYPEFGKYESLIRKERETIIS